MSRLILFLISPLFTFLLTLKHGFKYKYILILMFGIYGFTAVLKPGYDIHTNMIKYEMYNKDYARKDILSHFWNTLTFNKVPYYFDEIFMHAIGATLSFFHAPKYLFTGIIGLIYGYFFVGTFFIIFKKIQLVIGTNKIYQLPTSVILLLLLLVSWQAFEGINGVRFWTAMWMYFYSIFNYFETKKTKYLFLSILPIGFHFSFVIFTCLFFSFLLIKSNFKFFYLIFAISFLANFTGDFTSLRTGSSLFDQRIESYSYDVDSFEERKERKKLSESQKSFHARYSNAWMQFFLKYYFLLSISILAYKSRFISKDVKWFASLFCLLFACSNLLFMVPELSSRIYRVSVILGLFTIIYSKLKHYTLINRKWSRVLYKLPVIFSPVILLFIFTRLSVNIEVMSVYVLFPPFFFPFLSESNIAIKEAIKSIFI